MTRCSLRSFESVMSDSVFPRRLGNTSPVASPSVLASRRMSMARRHSGNAMVAVRLMRLAGTVQTAASEIDFVQLAARTSPDRAAVSTRKVEGELRADPRARRVDRLDCGGHVAVRERRHVPNHGLLAAERLPERVAGRVVGAILHPPRPTS